MADHDFWKRRRVLITGHTGFKGAWLATWLIELGSEVHGIGLEPPTHPSLFALNGLGGRMATAFGDLRDADTAIHAIRRAQPEVVFHLAAQSLVRRGVREPAETFETNVMGTVRLLDAIRMAPTVRAVVVVTSDKCYDDSGLGRGYREQDPLGGHDPYSASKGCQEIVAHAYRRSYLGGRLATARAGNVIGGGDWAEDRVVPDAVRAIAEGRQLQLRNPQSVRPWQHVLDPLAGYLQLAERLCLGNGGDRAWNFGPSDADTATVAKLADLFHQAWGRGSWVPVADPEAGREAKTLRLDASLARDKLGWAPRIGLDGAVRLTVDWYKAVLEGNVDPFELTCDQTRRHDRIEAA